MKFVCKVARKFIPKVYRILKSRTGKIRQKLSRKISKVSLNRRKKYLSTG